MTPPSDRWAEIDAVFEQVVELPEHERATFLDRSTSVDPELRAEVEALLASLEAAERRIGEAAFDMLPLGDTDFADAGLIERESNTTLPPGTPLGSYEVVREIGRGGMGAVYLARRADAAFDRDVAIKLVQDRRSGGAWQERFRAEQRILAALEHPNIARLYDSGATGSDRPFLIMEFVEGVRLDQHANAARLDVRQRLRLFLTVCDAVSYAHQRLVIHRDLKPANVLVDVNGRVKLLDFGIATLSDAPATSEADAADALGFASPHRMLTPEYASPEQMRGEVVGAASDVYALGVILHELLTGVRPPWQQRVRSRDSMDEVQRAMVAPSVTVRTQGPPEDRAERAHARGTTPDRLARTLAGDLDAVVLAALAPSPETRYSTAQALRDDVARVLDVRPVQARPAGVVHRVTRFVQRNRAVSLLGAAAVALAVSFAGSMVVQSRRVATERERARQVAAFLTGLFEAADPYGERNPDTVRAMQLIEDGVQQLEADTTLQPAIRAELFTVLGSILRNRDQLPRATGLLEEAVALRRGPARASRLELATTLSALGQTQAAQARWDDARRTHRAALDAYQRAGRRGESQAPQAMADLALTFMRTEQFDSATILFDRALDLLRASPAPDSTVLVRVLSDRALLAGEMGDATTALALTEQTLTVQRAFAGNGNPNTLVNIGNVAYQLDQLGRHDEALVLHREAVDGLRRRLGSDHKLVGGAMSNLAASLLRTDAKEEAVEVAREAVEIARRRTGGVHFDVALALNYLADAMFFAGQRDAAIDVLQESYEMHAATVGAEAPGTAIMQYRVAMARCRPNALATDKQRALAEFRQSIRIIDGAFTPEHPQRITSRVGFAVCLERLGQVAESRTELETQAELAWRNHPPTSPMVRQTVGALQALYRRHGDSARLAAVERLADSLGLALSR